jgi:hypothetical protein
LMFPFLCLSLSGSDSVLNSWIIEVGSVIFLSSFDQLFLEGEVNLHRPYLKATISATEKWKFFVIICIKVLFGSNNFDNLN